MNYGMPYMGSKNKIAPWIIEHLPEADNLYDLFGGGGAITHCAALSGKYKTIHYNDLIPGLTNVFKKVVNGEYKDYSTWVSREDFFNSDDIFVKMIYSFGNNCKTYMYSPQIEPWKKAIHYAVLFQDYSYFKEFGIDDVELKESTPHLRRLEFCKLYKKKEKEWKKKMKNLKESKKPERLQSLERLERFQRLEMLVNAINLERINDLENENLLTNIEYYEQSYDEFEIPENSVIYCDIPYKGTEKYSNKFDYEKFYKWACEQTVPIYISEYDMPSDKFEVIDEIEKTVILNDKKNKKAIEKIFIPIKEK